MKHYFTSVQVENSRMQSLPFTVFDFNYIFFALVSICVIVWCTTCGVLEVFGHVNKDIREVKHHVYVKWQTRICTT